MAGLMVVLLSGCASSRLATQEQKDTHDATIADVLMLGGSVTFAGGLIATIAVVNSGEEVDDAIIGTALGTAGLGALWMIIARAMWPAKTQVKTAADAQWEREEAARDAAFRKRWGMETETSTTAQ